MRKKSSTIKGEKDRLEFGGAISQGTRQRKCLFVIALRLCPARLMIVVQPQRIQGSHLHLRVLEDDREPMCLLQAQSGLVKISIQGLAVAECDQ